MKLFFVVVVSTMALCASDTQAPKKPAEETRAKPAAKAAPKAKAAPASGDKRVVVPAGAVRGADGDFYETDAEGKKWIYHETPFGVVRMEDTPEHRAGTAASAVSEGIKAFDEGDKVRFERRGPFGMWKWEKQKSELDEGEKAALERAQANKQNASKQD